MPAPPLTHHDILGLIEPFTRRGRHADLAASDRLQRCLVFRAPERAAQDAGSVRLEESLRLENPAAGSYRLTRVLTLPDGLAADLVAEGEDPARLLDQVEAVGWQLQFVLAPDHPIAASHRIDPGSGELLLTRASGHVGGLVLTMTAPTVRGASADLELHAAPADPIALPEDLFAVLGWDWGVMRRVPGGWRGSLRLRGAEPGRSRLGEQRMAEAVRHLARTLGEPPARFHERRVGARWVVAFRRALPVLVCLALVLGAAGTSRLELAQDSAFRMLLFNAPPLLLVLVFCMREMPRFEIPAAPRASRARAWRDVPHTGDGR